MDLKFGSRDRREKELRENRALQLAIYAWLRRDPEGVDWPATAFYILRTQTWMTAHAAAWPGATVVARNGAHPDAVCWTAFLDVCRWRRDQLRDGWIEVVVPGTDDLAEPDDAPPVSPPHPEWVPDLRKAMPDEYDALTGWESHA